MSHTNPIGSAGRSSLTSAGSCTWLLGRQRLHREGNWEEQRCPERQAGNHEGRGEPSERHLSDDVPSNNFLPCRASSSPILTQLLHIRACQVPPITKWCPHPFPSLGSIPQHLSPTPGPQQDKLDQHNSSEGAKLSLCPAPDVPWEPFPPADTLELYLTDQEKKL